MKILKVRLRWRPAGGDDMLSRLVWILAAIGFTGAGVAGTWVLYAHGGDKQAVAAHDMAEKLWGDRPPDYVVTVKDGVGTVTQASPQAPVMTVTLTASSQQAFTGQSVTLTATASKDVNGYVLEILDQTTGQWVGARVTYGITDTATVSKATPGSHTYVAYIVDPNNTSTPVAESGPVTVTWNPVYTVSLRASASTVAVGGDVTLTATANQDVAQHTLVIVDETTGEQVGAPTTSGMSAQAVVSQTSAGTHTYVALIQDQSGTLVESQPVSVTWAQANVTLQVDAPQSGLVAGKTAQVSGRVTMPDGTPVPGVTVSISATGGTITPVQITTDANGNFTATYTAPNTQGTYKITASCNGSTASTTVQVRQAFTVTLQASETALAIGQSVILTATSNQDVAPYSLVILDETTGQVIGGPVSSGTSLQAVVSQISAGTHTYVALIQDQSGTLAESPAVSVTWAQAVMTLQVSGAQSGLTPGQNAEITGRITLSDGTPVSGATVTLSANGGSLSPMQVTTDANGNFTATYTVPNDSGTYTITATGVGTSASVQVSVAASYASNVVATVPINNPIGVAYGGGYVYVTSNSLNTVSVIDASTNKVVKTVAVGSSPQDVAYGNGFVYVTNYASSGTVSVIDASTNRVVKTINVGSWPRGVAYGNGYVYVANSGSGTVSVIDASTNQVVATVPVGSNPEGVAYGNGFVYVTNLSSSNTVSVIDASTNQVVDTLSVGSYLWGVAYGNGYVYVATYYASSNTMYVIDASTNQVVATVPVGSFPRGVAYSNGYVYVANNGSGTVSVIDASTNQVVETVSVGKAPCDVAYGNGYVYVTNAGSNTVSVLH